MSPGASVTTIQNPQPEPGLPAGLAAPARRALAGAGYTRLEQLSGLSGAELMKLHGMGPKALDTVRHALAAQGLSLRVED